MAAFLHQSLMEVIDEAIDLFDRCLADTYARARHELEGFREVAARATNEKVYLFRELGRLVLDPTIHDEALRPAIYARIPPAVLRSAVDEADQIVRPLDDSYIDFLVSRYSYLRQFTPRFLEAFAFSSHTKLDPLLEALALLRALNATHRRTVPDDAPIDFVPATWRSYVIDREGHIDRHAYELCVLWELRGALRAGNVWLPASRRYADPETYLIPRDRWPTLPADVCRQMQTPEDPTVRLQERAHKLEDRLVRVDALLACGEHLRMEDGALIVPRLEAEDRPASVIELEQRIDARLPLTDLSELLAEVDEWTRFSRWFEHASGYEPPSRELRDHLYAALLAQGCNIGLTRMAQSSQTT